jgi:hypothetical protein
LRKPFGDRDNRKEHLEGQGKTVKGGQKLREAVAGEERERRERPSGPPREIADEDLT